MCCGSTSQKNYSFPGLSNKSSLPQELGLLGLNTGKQVIALFPHKAENVFSRFVSSLIFLSQKLSTS